jgi:hypothetical protein
MTFFRYSQKTAASAFAEAAVFCEYRLSSKECADALLPIEKEESFFRERKTLLFFYRNASHSFDSLLR